MPMPKKSKFTVFADERLAEETSKADELVAENTLPNDPTSEDDSQQQPSIFSKYLLEQTEDFTRKYSSSFPKESATASRTPSQATTTTGKPSQPPPAEISNEPLNADAKHAEEPLPEPLSPALPPNKLPLPSFLHHHSTTVKGSEDMLLIPESDAASIADSDFDPRDCEGEAFHVPASSPPPPAAVAHYGDDDDGGEDMLDDGTTRFPKLNLKRFAFGT